MEWLVPLPVAVPLAGAGLAVALSRRPNAQRAISVIALTVALVVSAFLLVAADGGPLVVNVGSWAAPLGISLVVDRLSALMLLVSAVVTLGVLLYSMAQGLSDREEGAPVAIFHPTFLVLASGVAIAFVSGDLFNLYVGFEVLLVASYVLLTLGGTGPRIRAATIYVVVAIFSSVLFLTGIALVYGATGTLNFAQLAIRLPEVDPGIRLVLELVLLMAFAIKAAIFPLSAWLPDAYPTAPAPVTAVFAGLLTKVGIYAIIRTQMLLFGDGRLDQLLMWAALATMLVGVLGAIAQTDLKRMLSFTLVSHIGYMVFGVALAGHGGLSGSIFYVAHHITVQTSLFLVVGLVERHGGSTSLARLGGLARATPALAVLYLVPALNLAGIPPMSGFLGKLGLLQAGVSAGTPVALVLVAGAVVTSLLTLYVVVRAWTRAFWHPPVEPPPVVATSRGMYGSAAALVAVGLSLAVFAAPLYDYVGRAADDLGDVSSYVDAVLPDGERGVGRSVGGGGG
jgi:multicomponent Na+:H+ antiporter subunit D